MRKTEYPAQGETLWSDTLPNGLRLRIVPKPGFRRAHAFLAADYGAADRRFLLDGAPVETPMGVAHYLEHKMFDMPEGDAMYAMAASGAQPNAFTTVGQTAYYFDTTAAFYENLEALLRFVSTPYFTPESVERERGIIAQEIRMTEDDPDYAIYMALLRALYAHHPVRDSVVGTVESIQAITPETLSRCHSVFYHPNNLCLAVVGDVDPVRVSDLARAILSESAGPKPVRDYGPPEDAGPSETLLRQRLEVSAPQFFFGAKLERSERGAALLRRKLALDLAVSYLYSQSSPFFTRLYREGLLNADFYAAVEDGPGTATLLAGGESRDPERVFAAAVAEARQAAAQGLDPARFELHRRVLYGRAIRSLDAFGPLCEALADAAFGDYDYLSAPALLQSLSAEEIRDEIARQLGEERFALSIAEPVREKGDAEHA